MGRGWFDLSRINRWIVVGYYRRVVRFWVGFIKVKGLGGGGGRIVFFCIDYIVLEVGELFRF